MKWHEHLYVSEKASRESLKRFGRMKNKFDFPAYMITLPSNPENLLDILSCQEINATPYYRDILVIGIANGKKDALELVRDIIWDTYSHTGGFEIQRYMEQNS
jgi:hypothetical protein